MYQHEQTRANKDASSTRNRIFLRNKDQIAQKKSAVSFRTMVLILLELVQRCLNTYKDTGSHFWYVEKKVIFFWGLRFLEVRRSEVRRSHVAGGTYGNIYNPKNIFTISESVIVALNDMSYKFTYQLKIYISV